MPILPASLPHVTLGLAEMLAQASHGPSHTARLFDTLYATLTIGPLWTRISLSQKAQPISEAQFLVVLSNWPLQPGCLTTPRTRYDPGRDIHLVITEYSTPTPISCR